MQPESIVCMLGLVAGRGPTYWLDVDDAASLPLAASEPERRTSAMHRLHSPLIWVEDQSVCRILGLSRMYGVYTTF